jgi:hypothetical protein
MQMPVLPKNKINADARIYPQASFTLLVGSPVIRKLKLQASF